MTERYFHPQDIERILTEVVNRFLIPKFKELGMNATGEWLESLEVTTGINSGTIRGRDYSQYLAKGRKPGQRPPIAPLEKWVNAKFGISGAQAKSMAFAIATKIAKEGTTWHQKGGSDLIEVLESAEVQEYITGEMRGMLQVELEQRLIRNAQEIFA